MAGGQTSKKKISLAVRRRWALELRMQGGSYREIAKALAGAVDEETGLVIASHRYDQTRAYADVMYELRRIQEESADTALQLLTLELVRIEELWQTYWPKALAGDYASFDRIMRLMDQRWRYTVGQESLTMQREARPHGSELSKIDINTLSNEALEALAAGDWQAFVQIRSEGRAYLYSGSDARRARLDSGQAHTEHRNARIDISDD